MPRTQGTNPDPKNPAREIGSYNQPLTYQASSAGRGGATSNVTTNRTYVLIANYETGNQALYAVNVVGGRGSPVATRTPNGRWEVTSATSNANERSALQQSLNRGNFGRTLNNELQTVATRDLGADQFNRRFKPVIARTPETGSPSGGTNPPAGSSAGSSVPEISAENSRTIQDVIGSTVKARGKYPASNELKYPIEYRGNDFMTIEMLRYVPEKNLGIGKVSGSEEGALIGETLSRIGKRTEEFYAKTKEAPLATITLPIPSNLTDANPVNWNNNDLTATTAYGAAAAGRVMTSGLDVFNQVGKEVQGAANVLTKQNEAIKTLVTTRLISTILGFQGNALLTRSTGAIVNPNTELLFTGPALRSFAFSFKMTPRSDKEAKSIKKIIRTLKQGMSVKRAAGGLFLASPNVFRITFYYVKPVTDENGNVSDEQKPVPHPYLPVLKLCALQNISVNYMPDGSYMTYGDGSMVGYDMTLNFGEISPIFDEDYDELDKRFETGDFSTIGH